MPKRERRKKSKRKEATTGFRKAMDRDFENSDSVSFAEPVFLRTYYRWKDASNRFRKDPPSGKIPKGWKRVEVRQYRNAHNRPVEAPEDPYRISTLEIRYREPKGRAWKRAENVDFRKPLLAALFDMGREDWRKPVRVLNDGAPAKWSENARRELRKYTVTALPQDSKLEISLSGPTVKDALASYGWEVAEWGEMVELLAQVKFYHEDADGYMQDDRFTVALTEDWRRNPQNTNSGLPEGESYGSILKNRLAIKIREAFANRQVRFTTLDKLEDLYESGLIEDEVYEKLAGRAQAQSVSMFIMIKIRRWKK